MHLPSSLVRIKRSLAERGILETFRASLVRVRTELLSLRHPTHPFDLRHNVDTSGLIRGRKLRSEHPHDSSITAYWGTSPSVFKAILESWQETLSGTPYDYTFIDIGCGKGRTLMIASNTSFKKIVGVELNPQLAGIARQNLATWQTVEHACNDITVLNADALEFPLPSSSALFFLFHPFDGAVMQLFLDRFAALSHSTPIDIVYVNPLHADLILNTPGASLLWSKDIPHSPEDAAVDVFRSSGELCHLYRLRPPTFTQ